MLPVGTGTDRFSCASCASTTGPILLFFGLRNPESRTNNFLARKLKKLTFISGWCNAVLLTLSFPCDAVVVMRCRLSTILRLATRATGWSKVTSFRLFHHATAPFISVTFPLVFYLFFISSPHPFFVRSLHLPSTSCVYVLSCTAKVKSRVF